MAGMDPGGDKMRKFVLFSGVMLLALSTSAFAQQRGNGGFNGGGGNNRNNQNGGGVMPLPEGVKSVVSIDAYNMLLAEVDRDGQQDLAPIIVRHVYSGGIAKLFGGSTVPTEQFVSPGLMGGNNRGNQTGANGLNNNNGNGNGFGGGFNGGGSNGGGFNSGGFGGNTGGFGGGGFGGNTNFGGGFGGGNFGAFQIRPTRRN